MALGAEALEAQTVLDFGAGERWRAVGTLTTSDTSLRVAILEHEVTGLSKTVRVLDTPFEGIKVMAISAGEVLFDVQGRATILRVSRGMGSEQGSYATPHPAEQNLEAKPAAPAGMTRVRLTLAQALEGAMEIRRAFWSGEIELGQNEDGIYGVRILEAPAGGVAQRLGLKANDVVVAINGRPATDEAAATAMLDTAEPGHSLPYAYRRGRSVGQGVVQIVDDDGS